AALMMLSAGVLTAVRTPVAAGEGRSPAFVGRCALRLGLVTGAALPLLSWLSAVSVDASLSVLGIDAFGAGLDLRAHLGTALLLGALWGAGAGAAGALAARASGAAGVRATWLARGAGVVGAPDAGGLRHGASASGPYPGHVQGAAGGNADPHRRAGDDVYGAPTVAGPLRPPPGAPRRPPHPGGRPPSRRWGEVPPPPPPPPPAPPRRPRDGQ
ncbi:streptophobe family protein, partial [Streptomyces sp. Tu 4128]|uniref:streptophobe family protein n=1 Tax=Streptomyces sp. Tu 4128 TaxID=1120314 RepID=UPI001F11D231